MMAPSETSYFTLRPCDKQIGLTDPKTESREHSISNSTANTSSLETSYLHDLGLPSLPPLSQLLTTDDKSSGTQNLANSTSVTTSLPTPVIRALVEAQQQQQEYFSTVTTTSPTSSNAVHTIPTTTTTTHDSPLSVAPSVVSAMPDSLGMIAPVSSMPTTTASLSMLMDPTSAMYLPPSQNELSDSTASVAATAAALMASNPMLPPPTNANPSSFYNIAPSTTTTVTSPINTTSPSNNDTTSSSSFMMPPNSMDPRDSMEKNYSFVAIPGANQRKRPRRRYDEIERLYHCIWPNCTKSYGTLNHLNAHVSMQKHGAKRHPSEFKEMRKNWRRQKKEREAARKANEKENLASSSMMNTMNVNMATGTTNDTGLRTCMIPHSLQSYNTYAPFPSVYTSLPQSMASISAFY